MFLISHETVHHLFSAFSLQEESETDYLDSLILMVTLMVELGSWEAAFGCSVWVGSTVGAGSCKVS